MEKPHTGSSIHQSGNEAPDVKALDLEREWLVAQLSDEAEYWKAKAEAIDRVLKEVIAEVDARDRHAESSRSWPLGSAAQLSEDMGFGGDPAPFVRAARLMLLASLILWALLGLLAFVAYHYIAG